MGALWAKAAVARKASGRTVIERMDMSGIGSSAEGCENSMTVLTVIRVQGTQGASTGR